MLKLVIFDMDGLMFDTERITCDAFLEVAKELGFEATEEMYLMQLGLKMGDILNQYKQFFGDDIDAAALYKKVGKRKYEIIDRKGLPVKKGLGTLLDFLDENGIMKAVASSSDHENILKNLSLTGFSDRFDYILSAKDKGIKRGKPHPDIFLAVCDALKTAPENALVLEDSLNGIQASVAGGIPVIAVPDMVPIPDEVKGKCLAVVSDLTKVIDYIS